MPPQTLHCRPTGWWSKRTSHISAHLALRVLSFTMTKSSYIHCSRIQSNFQNGLYFTKYPPTVDTLFWILILNVSIFLVNRIYKTRCLQFCIKRSRFILLILFVQKERVTRATIVLWLTHNQIWVLRWTRTQAYKISQTIQFQYTISMTYPPPIVKQKWRNKYF